MSTPSPASAMRAWQFTPATGGLDKSIKLNESAPVPQPTPSQHLVKVIATSINPVDYKLAEIPMLSSLILPNPATPGSDFAGRLVAPAAGSSLKPGQLVYSGSAKLPLAGGGLAEYVLAGKDAIVALPDGVDPVDAATIRIAGLTAYQSIVPNVKRGDKVFINGGSGGTGSYGIQIAKAIGCHVTTTCSTANVELCKSLGADEVVDYRKQDVAEALTTGSQKFNLIVDNVANPALYFQSHHFTEPDAKYVLVGGPARFSFIWDVLKMLLWPSFLGGGQRKIRPLQVNWNAEDLSKIAGWIKTGEVKPLIDSRFPFEQVPQAYEKLKTGRAKGKIVVEVNLGA